MKKLIASLLFITLFAAVPATAQAPECDPAALITSLAQMSPSGDSDADMATLVEVRDSITAQQIACKGYVFEGAGKQIIRPFDLPKGIYVIHFEAGAGVALVTSQVISGNCDEYFSLLSMNMEGDTDAESTFESEGCKVALEVDYTARAEQKWKLIIEPLQ